jgi:hypothetical protein
MLTRTIAVALLVAAPALAQDAPRTAKQSPPPQAERELRAADDVDHQDGPQRPDAPPEAGSLDDTPDAEAVDDIAEDATDGDEETEAERPDDI